MKCPKCAKSSDRVTDSRLSNDKTPVRRRRECLKCSHRFTTCEIAVSPEDQRAQFRGSAMAKELTRRALVHRFGDEGGAELRERVRRILEDLTALSEALEMEAET